MPTFSIRGSTFKGTSVPFRRGIGGSALIGIKVEGKRNIISNLQKEKILMNRKIRRGIEKAADFLLEKSKPLVPVDTGDLKDTGHVFISRTGSTSEFEAQVSYGTHYAIYVHEDLGAFHQPPTSAKFLEIPFRRWKKHMGNIVESELSKAL